MRICSICDELACQPKSRIGILLSGHNIFNAILGRTSNLAIIPSIGPLVEGHNLLITNKHTNSIFYTDDATGRIQEIRDILNKHYKDIVKGSNKVMLCFEHGAYDCSFDRELCSTSHAHLHAMPLGRELARRIIKEVGNVRTYTSFSGAFEDIRKYKEYLIVFVYDKKTGAVITSLSDASRLPSQYMRILISKYINNDKWNWKKYNNAKLLYKMIGSGGYERNCKIAVRWHDKSSRNKEKVISSAV